MSALGHHGFEREIYLYLAVTRSLLNMQTKKIIIFYALTYTFTLSMIALFQSSWADGMPANFTEYTTLSSGEMDKGGAHFMLGKCLMVIPASK